MLGNAQPKAFKRHPYPNEPFSSTRLDDEHPTLRDCWHLNRTNFQVMNRQKTILVLAVYGISKGRHTTLSPWRQSFPRKFSTTLVVGQKLMSIFLKL